MSITVLNRHNVGSGRSRDGLYIGRPSALANPFKVETGRSRRQAIEQFRKWAIHTVTQLPEHPFTVAMKNLKARHDAGEHIDLVCSCKPKACHGDVITELLEEGLV